MQFGRIQDIVNKVTIKKSEIYERVKEGTFPEPIKISERISVWDIDTVDLWMTFKKEMSKNNIEFTSRTEEAKAWSKFRNDHMKNHKEQYRTNSNYKRGQKDERK